ncbi:alpha-1,3-arabinosyltransferase XAT3-like isoform X1 [Typha latifolia]|uniref:alpha-1,3-arabinosyltransferase XAT3-like isoform X1 n=1 Tax=Typha latifolia TaxID=4733 RepID=UPI003C30C2F6
MKWIRNLSRINAQKFGIVLLLGCSLVLLAYFSTSEQFASPYSITVDFEVTSTHMSSDALVGDNRTSEKLAVTAEPQEKLVCNLADWRSDVCEMHGDVRMDGISSSVLFVSSSEIGNSALNETVIIRPYARKADKILMAKIKEVFIKSLNNPAEAPTCTENHSIPAVVFALGGFTGNYWHDFTDVIVPLFITSRQFNGEVQFLIAAMRTWWVNKYGNILKQLSHYKVIDFNKEDEVHCYSHATIGLHSHKDFTIIPLRAPNNYSMVDFGKFLRTAYSLDRDSAINLVEDHVEKPRLMIIARNRTRRLTNIDQIVPMAMELGFDVMVEEASFFTQVAQYAQVVNSLDVMIGVHGAGLTNMVFLPTNAVVIEIVPFGNIERIAQNDFGNSAVDLKLKYLQYSISEEESTLMDLYPRDHPVFKDPISIHKQGWTAMGRIYLVEQNVKLNVTRFRPFLLKALELLRH